MTRTLSSHRAVEVVALALVAMLTPTRAHATEPEDFPTCMQSRAECIAERTAIADELLECRAQVDKAGQNFASATSQLELLATENKSLGASLGMCEANLGQLVALDASQKQRLADSNRELTEARAKVTQFAEAQAQAQAERNTLSTELAQLKAQHDAMRDENTKLRRLRSQIEARGDKQVCKAAIEVIEEEIGSNDQGLEQLRARKLEKDKLLDATDKKLRVKEDQVTTALGETKSLEASREQPLDQVKQAKDQLRAVLVEVNTALVGIAVMVLLVLVLWGSIRFRAIYKTIRFDIHRARYLNPYYEIARRQVARYEAFASVAPILLIVFTVCTLAFLIVVGSTIFASVTETFGIEGVSSAAWPLLFGLFTPIGGLLAMYHNMETRLRESIEFVGALQKSDAARRIPREEASLVLMLEVCAFHILRAAASRGDTEGEVEAIAQRWIDKAKAVTGRDGAVGIIEDLMADANIPAGTIEGVGDWYSTVLVFLGDHGEEHEEQWHSIRYWTAEVFEAALFVYSRPGRVFRSRLMPARLSSPPAKPPVPEPSLEPDPD